MSTNPRNDKVFIAAVFTAGMAAAAMGWIALNGGLSLRRDANAAPAMEACGAVVAGSSAMTSALAPAIARAFLTKGGYRIEPDAQEGDGALRIRGVRTDAQCTIIVRRSTSSKALQDLAQRRATIALTQRPLTDRDIDLLTASGAGDFAAERATAEHVVAFDIYGVVVNAANPVKSLPYDSMRDIVFGAKTNWADYGGPDAPLSLYSVTDGSQASDYPNDLVQHYNQAWVDAVSRGKILDNEDEAAAAVERDPNALAFMSAALVKTHPRMRGMALTFAGPAREPTPANVLNETYPMARRLFAYARPSDMGEGGFAKSFISFFQSPEAFDIIDAAGFVALRPTSRLSQVAEGLSGCRFGTAEYSALISATRNARKMPVQLHFDAGTLDLDAAAQDYIRAQSGLYRQEMAAGASIIVVGHTDYTGDVGKNREMSMKRALAVRAAFEQVGVFGIEVEGAGEICPTADNQSEAGRLLNRRVEIWVRPGTPQGAAPASAAASQ